MTVKVLVTQTGQQIISEVKQVENKESKEVIAYWLINPRVVTYNLAENDQVNVGFGSFCLVSRETEFSLKADYVVSILEPREDVLDRYSKLVEEANPPESEEDESEDTDSADDSEDGAEADSAE